MIKFIHCTGYWRREGEKFQYNKRIENAKYRTKVYWYKYVVCISICTIAHFRRRIRKATEELYHLPVEERKCLGNEKVCRYTHKVIIFSHSLKVSLTPSTSASINHVIKDNREDLKEESISLSREDETKSSATCASTWVAKYILPQLGILNKACACSYIVIYSVRSLADNCLTYVLCYIKYIRF